MAGLRLLVIDDEPAVTLVLSHAARGWGHSIVTARTLAEARHAMEFPPIDVFLIDVRLPDGSGLDLLADIRRDPTYQTHPAIVLTGAGDDQLHDDARALGATVVTKPFSPTKLGDLITELTTPDESAPS